MRLLKKRSPWPFLSYFQKAKVLLCFIKVQSSIFLYNLLRINGPNHSFQAIYPFEMPNVVCHENQIMGHGTRGDDQISISISKAKLRARSSSRISALDRDPIKFVRIDLGRLMSSSQ